MGSAEWVRFHRIAARHIYSPGRHRLVQEHLLGYILDPSAVDRCAGYCGIGVIIAIDSVYNLRELDSSSKSLRLCVRRSWVCIYPGSARNTLGAGLRRNRPPSIDIPRGLRNRPAWTALRLPAHGHPSAPDDTVALRSSSTPVERAPGPNTFATCLRWSDPWWMRR